MKVPAAVGFLLLLSASAALADPIDLDRAPRTATLGALFRASEWMAAFPEAELRFDAAVGLHSIRRVVDGAALGRAWERARTVADRDHDHPLRRLWSPEAAADREAILGWRPPAAGEPRANVNRVIHEALYCDTLGLRDETLAYLSGPMRDDGGYHTTHAAWALVIAHDRGCIDEKRFARIARSLRHELFAAQPRRLAPAATLDIDLFAERTLMLALLGKRGRRLRRFADALVACQSADGSWGDPAEAEPPYYRYHATMLASWALTAVLAAR